jgi:hypothetical protein
MKLSRSFFALFLVAFTGLLIWIASEPRYLPDQKSRGIWANRREDPQAWEKEKQRLREPRLITNNIIMALCALDGLGIVALVHGLWRERRAGDSSPSPQRPEQGRGG